MSNTLINKTGSFGNQSKDKKHKNNSNNELGNSIFLGDKEIKIVKGHFSNNETTDVKEIFYYPEKIIVNNELSINSRLIEVSPENFLKLAKAGDVWNALKALYFNSNNKKTFSWEGFTKVLFYEDKNMKDGSVLFHICSGVEFDKFFADLIQFQEQDKITTDNITNLLQHEGKRDSPCIHLLAKNGKLLEILKAINLDKTLIYEVKMLLSCPSTIDNGSRPLHAIVYDNLKNDKAKPSDFMNWFLSKEMDWDTLESILLQKGGIGNRSVVGEWAYWGYIDDFLKCMYSYCLKNEKAKELVRKLLLSPIDTENDNIIARSLNFGLSNSFSGQLKDYVKAKIISGQELIKILCMPFKKYTDLSIHVFFLLTSIYDYQSERFSVLFFNLIEFLQYVKEGLLCLDDLKPIFALTKSNKEEKCLPQLFNKEQIKSLIEKLESIKGCTNKFLEEIGLIKKSTEEIKEL